MGLLDELLSNALRDAFGGAGTGAAAGAPPPAASAAGPLVEALLRQLNAPAIDLGAKILAGLGQGSAGTR